MPLLDIIKAESYNIGIWKITETEESLFSSVKISNEEKDYFSKIKNASRRKEWLAVRLVLLELLEKQVLISYNKNGKPYLNNCNYNISISHSKELVAVIIGKNKSYGIDIEKISEKPKRVSRKFLSKNELQIYSDSSNTIFTFLWSVKESVFKLYSDFHLEFDTQIILPFSDFINDGFITARIKFSANEHKQVVFYKKIDNFALTWTTENN